MLNLYQLHLNFNRVKVTLLPTAVETTNILITNQMYPAAQQALFFIFSRVIPSVFIIRGCYIPFQFKLVTALYYFHRIYENDPLGNTPLSENDPQNQSRFWKWPLGKMPPSPTPSLTYKGSASYCPPTWYSRVLLIQVYTGKIQQFLLVCSCCGFAFISVLVLVERF